MSVLLVRCLYTSWSVCTAQARHTAAGCMYTSWSTAVKCGCCPLAVSVQLAGPQLRTFWGVCTPAPKALRCTYSSGCALRAHLVCLEGPSRALLMFLFKRITQTFCSLLFGCMYGRAQPLLSGVHTPQRSWAVRTPRMEASVDFSRVCRQEHF